ncbi:MAG: hypothetical protein DI535_18810 [Citrobacter freundii]|nr:MAG: hypothetical protein DI535_18810 [Citrobacter freundii]
MTDKTFFISVLFKVINDATKLDLFKMKSNEHIMLSVVYFMGRRGEQRFGRFGKFERFERFQGVQRFQEFQRLTSRMDKLR